MQKLHSLCRTVLGHLTNHRSWLHRKKGSPEKPLRAAYEPLVEENAATPFDGVRRPDETGITTDAITVTKIYASGICCPSEVPLIINILRPLPGVAEVSCAPPDGNRATTRARGSVRVQLTFCNKWCGLLLANSSSTSSTCHHISCMPAKLVGRYCCSQMAGLALLGNSTRPLIALLLVLA